MEIVQAGPEHLEALVSLLDGYRVFYGQNPDPGAARIFLRQRLQKGDSTIFLAFEAGEATGFTQLYPSFSTVSLQPLLILNDLYVAPKHRKRGMGEALLRRAQEYCYASHCKGLALETGVDNPARLLYERLGWEKESHCFHYFWTCRQMNPY
jgi:GNAT superfamily N-acetyltransferase